MAFCSYAFAGKAKKYLADLSYVNIDRLYTLQQTLHHSQHNFLAPYIFCDVN